MDKPKSEVVKSKSISTSEAKNNTQRHHKKSRSNAEFKPLLLKKRGVYVEKKAVSIRNRERSPDSDLAKQASPCLRHIPRPGRKRFVASVLSILSKSTAGTQCPDGTDGVDNYEKTINKLKKKKNEDVIHEDSVTPARRKHRHRTKVSNNCTEPEQQFAPPVVILQSTKDITRTSSNYSVICNNDKESVSTYIDRKAFVWTNALQQQVMNGLDIPAPESTTINIIDNIKDPSTIITDVPIKDDKNIYNFFVDLLKTTFSVYNVKTEYKQPPPSSRNSSKVELEIDESVAKKLNIETIEVSKESCEATGKPSSDFYYNIRPDDRLQWDDDQLVEHFQPKLSRKSRSESPVKRKRKLKSDSFNYKKAAYKNDLFNITSQTTTNKKKNKKIPKKDLKRDFLNSLKQQLQMRTEELEEPQNFFEALKVIAKNKKRCQKSISIKESKKPSEGDVHVCQFKRRRVLSAKPRGKQSNNPESRYARSSKPTSSKRRTSIRIADSDSEMDRSEHSLRVFGYDYEPTKEVRVEKYDDSDFILPTLTTPPIVAQDYQNYMD